MRVRHALLLSIIVVPTACSPTVVRDEGIDPPCLPQDAHMCTPEEAATLTESEILLVGPSITLNCGVSGATERETARNSCEGRTARALKQLASLSAAIDNSSRIEVSETRICVDTFIPGREMADCEFFQISARVTFRLPR